MKKIEELQKEFDDFVEQWQWNLDGYRYSRNDFLYPANKIKKLIEEIKSEFKSK